MSGGGEEPIYLDVQTPQGSTVARLLAGPRSTILGVKAQLAGVEGTAIDNQTLLLDGRVLDDGATLLASAVPPGGSATLTLVRCTPLLTGGRLSKLDLQRLTTDGEALARSIDAFNGDPRYDAAEIAEIVTAAARAMRPSEHGLASEILESLPLELLASNEVAEARALLGDASEERIAAADVEATARHLLPEPAAEPPPRLMTESPSRAAGVPHFNIGEDVDPLIQRARRARREQFTSCVRTALELLLLALEEDT